MGAVKSAAPFLVSVPHSHYLPRLLPLIKTFSSLIYGTCTHDFVTWHSFRWEVASCVSPLHCHQPDPFLSILSYSLLAHFAQYHRHGRFGESLKLAIFLIPGTAPGLGKPVRLWFVQKKSAREPGINYSGRSEIEYTRERGKVG